MVFAFALTLQIGKHIIVAEEYMTTIWTMTALALALTFTFSFVPEEVSRAFVHSTNFTPSLTREASPFTFSVTIAHEYMLRC